MTEVSKNPEFLWGAQEIGKFIGKSSRATFHLLEGGKIPGRKIGRQWISTRQELASALTTERREREPA